MPFRWSSLSNFKHPLVPLPDITPQQRLYFILHYHIKYIFQTKYVFNLRCKLCIWIGQRLYFETFAETIHRKIKYKLIFTFLQHVHVHVLDTHLEKERNIDISNKAIHVLLFKRGRELIRMFSLTPILDSMSIMWKYFIKNSFTYWWWWKSIFKRTHNIWEGYSIIQPRKLDLTLIPYLSLIHISEPTRPY